MTPTATRRPITYQSKLTNTENTVCLLKMEQKIDIGRRNDDETKYKFIKRER